MACHVSGGSTSLIIQKLGSRFENPSDTCLGATFRLKICTFITSQCRTGLRKNCNVPTISGHSNPLLQSTEQ